MRKLIPYILCLWAIILLAGCTDSRIEKALTQIDTLITNHPDSALRQFDILRAKKPQWAKSQRMRFDLLEAKAQNKAFIPFTTDSIAKDFTQYYDNNGTNNDRLLAYYLLGCVYRDLGEAPQAIDSYLTAVSKADTTAANCDYNTLCAVYSQMANLYHTQLLLTNEIQSRKKTSYYAHKANDLYLELYNLARIAGVYILMNKKDSAEIALKESIRRYEQNGFAQKALQASTKLMFMYVKEPDRLEEAKQLMDKYERESSLFDSNHELPPSKRQYYYYKGQYFENTHQLDSAEYYYRKIYRPNMDYVSFNPMYEGLLSIFKKRHQADSIAKYAQLYCEVNDSSIAKKDQELTAQMTASYNYSRFQKEALENEQKAHRTQNELVGVIIIGTIIAIIIYTLWKRNRKRHVALKLEYANATDEYNKNLQTLQLLDSLHQELYEAKKQELIQENEILKAKIEDLKRQEGIRLQITKSQQFTETAIVKRISDLNEHPLTDMTEAEWDQLLTTVSNYYPTLLHDLNSLPKITLQEIRVCLLMCLSIRESDIARLLKTTSQRVTNMKSSLNKELFGDNSARTLYKNLTQRYEIFTL